ncbi:MAG: DNA double-strand break repair nuclease NurA [Candidatus Norongarragalinales archaeon]
MDSWEEAVKKLRDLEERQARLCARLRESPELEAREVFDERLFLPVKRQQFSGRVAAVDGGIALVELHGLDLLFYRAAAAVFDYSEGRLRGHHYFPSKFVALQFLANYSWEPFEVAWMKSLKRLGVELDCALGVLKKFSPQVLLLDGSIVPQTADKPPRESRVFSEYERVIEKYLRLYGEVEERGALLAGVVKDSRAKHFAAIVASCFPEARGLLGEAGRTTDSLFLYFLLGEGERSACFSYSSIPSEHGVLRDLGKWAERVCSFYVKPVAFDRPLRVDFLRGKTVGGREGAEEVASIVFSLSAINRAYGYPAALIEADLRAAIEGRELENEVARFRSKLGFSASLFGLRRNERPFR